MSHDSDDSTDSQNRFASFQLSSRRPSYVDVDHPLNRFAVGFTPL
eukprot:COSAG04_NODE_23214_length_342_cov_0.625514_1_plen_44_part_10